MATAQQQFGRLRPLQIIPRVDDAGIDLFARLGADERQPAAGGLLFHRNHETTFSWKRSDQSAAASARSRTDRNCVNAVQTRGFLPGTGTPLSHIPIPRPASIWATPRGAAESPLQLIETSTEWQRSGVPAEHGRSPTPSRCANARYWGG